MKLITTTISGTSRYSQSRAHGLIRGADESPDDFDLRTVKDHLHCDEAGMVYIPGGSFKNCLDEAASLLSIKKAGSSKYTKNFEAGVAVFENVPLGVHRDDVKFEKLFLNSDGKRGGGSRVFRHYPYVDAGWKVSVPFSILDETVLNRYEGDKTKTIFEHVLRSAGLLVGIGRWRPRNRGLYGRFQVLNLVVNEFETELAEAAE